MTTADTPTHHPEEPQPSAEEKQRKQRRTLLIIAGVVGALVLACGVLIVVGAFAITRISERVVRGPTVQVVDELPTPPPPEQMPPNGTIDEQFETIEDLVVGIRGLPLAYDVPEAFLDEAALEEAIQEDFFAEYSSEEAADDVLIFAALDVFPRDFDLYTFYIDLYSSGVAGFYDSEEEAFYLVGDDADLGPDEEITYAHELTHVLQDQNFDLDAFMRWDDEEWSLENPDAAAARLAVIEGDATLTETLYEQNYLLPERRDALYQTYSEIDLSFFQTVPPFVLREFIFPYSEGYDFVRAVYEQGGFAAVDALYENPPTSTEQILHPEKFFAGEAPREVPIADFSGALGPGYRLVDSSELGEFTLRNYIQQRLEFRADDAADGWAGDAYSVYTNDATGALVFVADLAWDSASEAEEFLSIYADYARLWAGDSDPLIEAEGVTCWEGGLGALCTFGSVADMTHIVRADDLDTALLLVEEYGFSIAVPQ